MNRMPCGLEDDRVRFEPEAEDEDPRTDMEKRISWICDDWHDALINDTYEDWRDLRMMTYGAYQSLIHCKDRFDDLEALRELGNIAFARGIDRIGR